MKEDNYLQILSHLFKMKESTQFIMNNIDDSVVTSDCKLNAHIMSIDLQWRIENALDLFISDDLDEAIDDNYQELMESSGHIVNDFLDKMMSSPNSTQTRGVSNE